MLLSRELREKTTAAANAKQFKLRLWPDSDGVYDIYINSLAKSGRSGIHSLLNTCAKRLAPSCTAQTFPWHSLNYARVSKLRALLLDEGYSIASVNMALAALRGLAKVAFNVGQLGADELSRIHAVPRVKGEVLSRGRSLARAEVKALLTAARDHELIARRTRDRALVLVACGAGLRAAELVSLRVMDFEPDSGVLQIKHGKGRKQRSVYLAKPICTSLKSWLASRGDQEGALFTRINRGGELAGSQLTKCGLTSILEELAAKAKVDRFTPHDLRRTFITHLLDAGIDINTVRQLAGHSSITTTARYDCRNEKAKISASRAFSCW